MSGGKGGNILYLSLSPIALQYQNNGKGVGLIIDTIGGIYWEGNIDDVLAQDGHMVLLRLLGGE